MIVSGFGWVASLESVKSGKTTSGITTESLRMTIQKTAICV